MIKKIVMSNVASYKDETELVTDKRTTLIYGLNGSGKSTFSDFMYNINNPDYNKCHIDGLTSENDLLVYNQSFVNDNFYEKDSLSGIFTLSKRNATAEKTISNAKIEIKRLSDLIIKKGEEKQKLQRDEDEMATSIENKIWELKTKYSGSGKTLDSCFEGLKTKTKLFEYVVNLTEQKEKPLKSIEEIIQEIKDLINADNKESFVTLLDIDLKKVEKAEIFKKTIVGNDNSTLSQFIKEKNNSDWVKLGRQYISMSNNEDEQMCPFCQSKTITQNFIDNLKLFFDESYENDIINIKNLMQLYEESYNEISEFNINSNKAINKEEFLEFDSKKKDITNHIIENIRLIKEKINSPSNVIVLYDTSEDLETMNILIQNINLKIKQYNDKIDAKEKNIEILKKEFWKNISWDYKTIIEHYNSEIKKYGINKDSITKSIDKLESDKMHQNEIIITEQKKLVNIDEAIDSINEGLKEVGIDDFSIQKSEDEKTYKIIRKDADRNIFKSLSEGEKMLISFLYFIELCKGSKTDTGLNKKKIIVIDDPITSMSHIYVFNIGRMIYNEFFINDKYEQIFILTHSLYFFYELTCMKKEDRDNKQKLIRIHKDSNGSKFTDMRYQDIQNDYQAYWGIIRDCEQQPALIANCMRNIIEYFFNFIEKNELNNVFQKQIFKDNRYQAFNRYINRESHSIGQNIFDLKEFNYENFKEAFKMVFVEAGYENHYNKMMK